jgi:hypothetical protein
MGPDKLEPVIIVDCEVEGPLPETYVKAVKGVPELIAGVNETGVVPIIDGGEIFILVVLLLLALFLQTTTLNTKEFKAGIVVAGTVKVKVPAVAPVTVPKFEPVGLAFAKGAVNAPEVVGAARPVKVVPPSIEYPAATTTLLTVVTFSTVKVKELVVIL